MDEVCLSACPYVSLYVWMAICPSVCLSIHPCLSVHLYTHCYICTSIGTLITYITTIVSLLPFQFAQILTLTELVPWLTGVAEAYISDRTHGCSDMPNDVFVITTFRVAPVVAHTPGG